MKNFKSKCKEIFLSSGFLTTTDYIIMGILTLIFLILVFFKLGNTYAPQTMYTTDETNKDIIIDFGDYISIDRLYIYLGYEANRNLSLSTFNEVTQTWEVINTENNVGSVFQWNSVNIYYKLRYLGIVATDDMAAFNEFVFIGPDGERILPVNANQYPELFDEQDMFFDTTNTTYMNGTMFDEVYHGRTGYEFVHGLPTYETTHPQFGKCLIALGIKMFGMTPFGWRFFSCIFGIIFIPLMYVFAKRLFKDTFVAACVGIMITFDCMHYTLSRIATIDIFVAFFIILAYYFLFKYFELDTIYHQNTKKFKKDTFPPVEIYRPLALSGIAMGLAIATKLTGVYAAVGMAILLIIHLIKNPPKHQTVKLFWFCFAFFIVTPLVLYTLAYIPTVELYADPINGDRSVSWNENGLYIGYGYTGLLARTLRNTNYMINYHSNLEATHYYGSPFYEWPIMKMPLLAACDTVNEYGDISAVSYIGNVVIWWSAIPCVIYTLYLALFKKDKTARFLLISYLAQYVPWMSVKRLTFIYHYLPSAIFSMFMIGLTIKKIIEKYPKAVKYVRVYLGLIVLAFLLYFPVISGIPFAKAWGEHLRLLKSWILVL